MLLLLRIRLIGVVLIKQVVGKKGFDYLHCGNEMKNTYLLCSQEYYVLLIIKQVLVGTCLIWRIQVVTNSTGLIHLLFKCVNVSHSLVFR